MHQCLQAKADRGRVSQPQDSVRRRTSGVVVLMDPIHYRALDMDRVDANVLVTDWSRVRTEKRVTIEDDKSDGIVETHFTLGSGDALVDTAAGQPLMGPAALESITTALEAVGVRPIKIPRKDLPTAKGVGGGCARPP